MTTLTNRYIHPFAHLLKAGSTMSLEERQQARQSTPYQPSGGGGFFDRVTTGMGNVLGGIGRAGQAVHQAPGNIISGVRSGMMDAANQEFQDSGRASLGGAMAGGWRGAGRAIGDTLGGIGGGAMRSARGVAQGAHAAGDAFSRVNPITAGMRAGGAVTGRMEDALNQHLQAQAGAQPSASARVGPAQPASGPGFTGRIQNWMDQTRERYGDWQSRTNYLTGEPNRPSAPQQNVGASLFGTNTAPAPDPAYGPAPSVGPGGVPNMTNTGTTAGFNPQQQAAAPPDPIDWQAQFQQQTATPFDPNSRMDHYNMQLLQSGQSPMSLQQWQQAGRPVADQRFKSAGVIDAHVDQVITPFAVFEMKKEAQTVAQQGARGIAGWFRDRLTNVGSRARSSALSDRMSIGGPATDRAHRLRVAGASPTGPEREQILAEARDRMAQIGNFRLWAGNRLTSAGRAIDESPMLQGLLNYGIPTAGLGGAGLVGHGMGRRRGMSEGFDIGADSGIQATLGSMPQDPGVLGRLAGVFGGYPQGPQAYDIQALLDANKQDILRQLRGR